LGPIERYVLKRGTPLPALGEKRGSVQEQLSVNENEDVMRWKVQEKGGKINRKQEGGAHCNAKKKEDKGNRGKNPPKEGLSS